MALARRLAAIAIVLASAPVLAEERSGGEDALPFQAGSLLGHSELESARDWLPPEARAHVALLLPVAGRIRLGAPSKTLAPAASDCGGDPTHEIWSLLQASEIGRGGLWSYRRWAKREHETVAGDARGVTILRYRGDAGAVEDGAGSDFWIYLPERRAPRDEVAPPAYSWSCLGRADVLAPLPGSDGSDDETETWALREAWVIRFETKHPAGGGPSSVFYLDGASRKPLFAFCYDGRGALRRIVIADRRVVDVEPHEPRSNAVRE